ncbi:hypothetical protein GRX01_08260 [Halobaculum sp. WSA2]|uniref:L-alanine-DL-glutamate epimerase n=1 Tax=Halobaculum saliterrae TaxID=2073113 RepID=A0A6B0SZC9_9EURY|nr:hypothetical protein [Halobaculum saliterrae]MXR41330.1 hypothetical protein [Halobaculum saliterrae]
MSTPTLYRAIADLPLTIESVGLRRRARDTSSGFERVSTTFRLRGDGELGRGEDVTYDAPDHDALFANPERDPRTPADGLGFEAALVGEWTFREFSNRLDDVDLFPKGEPERDTGHAYRRWAVESAATDLALRQADTDLASILDRERDPVAFAASTRLGEPSESGTDSNSRAGDPQGPSADRVTAIAERVPGIGFKLDPTDDWTDEVVADLPTERVRVLDLKGLYEGTEVDQEPDAEFYEWVLESFPNAVIEDPAVTDETRHAFEGEEHRVSWDYPITGVASVEDLPWEPEWLNVKPSRFGTLESLSDTLEWARERDVTLYGGGQFELGVGRDQLHALASVFHPDGPNDVAPGAFNDPAVPERLPATPLAPSAAPRGFEF